MFVAGNWAVTGKTDFRFRITYHNNNYGMVTSAEGYEAVTVTFNCTPLHALQSCLV